MNGNARSPLVGFFLLLCVMALSGCGSDSGSGSPSSPSDATDTPSGDVGGDPAPDQTDDQGVDQTVDDSPTDSRTDSGQDQSTTDTSPPDLNMGDAGDYDIEGLECINALYAILDVIADSVFVETDGGECPTYSREGAGANQTVTLTWGDTCEWSGSLVVEIERTGVGQGNLAVTFDDLNMDGMGVEGTASGTYSTSGNAVTLDLALDLSITGSTACEIDGTGVAVVDAVNIALDAVLTINEASFTIADLEMATSELNSECPMPHSGTIVYDPQAGPTVTIAFDEESPETDTVDISSEGQTVEDVNYCAYLY